MSQGHIADAETEFKALNVTPDFCEVHGRVVPYDIHRDLTPERVNYTKKVRSRGVVLVTVKSVVAGVIGNQGKGVFSHVAKGDGNTIIPHGVEKIRAEGNKVCRDQDLCLMNGKVTVL